MTFPRHRRFLHTFAVLTVAVMMTTLSAGALVTSKNAGMAFRDWPTSDGQAMLAYPWWQDFASNWDKFLEHGHRLAGVMIGCWVIALVGFVAWLEPRKWVKGLTVALLCGVIIQGILGGFRVWLDERGLAMVHGFFAACVTACLATTVTVLSKRWIAAAEDWRAARVGYLRPFAVTTLVLVTAQYLLGGAIRHHHTGLYEHLGLGILTGLVIAANAVAAQMSGVFWLRRMGWAMFAVTLIQIGLGAGAWISRWGYAPAGFVATADSVHNVAIRTAHMVTGIIVFASAVVNCLRVFRVNYVSEYVEPELVLTAAVPTSGGAA